MLIWVPLGFVAIFAYSLWLTARIAARRQSAGSAFVIGFIAAFVLWALYLIALAQWARAICRRIDNLLTAHHHRQTLPTYINNAKRWKYHF